jgi:HTH-type transcriptional regulator, sugar sensing transcriptional regulator
MIVKEQFLQKLRTAFSLNIYEVKIWTALLSRGISTAGELSDISEVPRSRSYDVLETLEKKGFVIMKLGKPIKYIAVKPEDIIKRIKTNVESNLTKKLKQLDEIKDTPFYDELQKLHTTGVKLVEPSDFTGSVKSRDNIYQKISTMLDNAKESVTLVTSSEGLVRKNNLIKKALKKLKNVKVRVVAPINKTNLDVVKELSEFAEIKNTQRINARFVIVDNKEVMFMVLGDDEVHANYDVGVWLDSPFFANAMNNMFDVVWNNLEDGKSFVGKLGKK